MPPLLIDRPPFGYVECKETGLWVHHSDLAEHRKTCAPCRAEDGATVQEGSDDGN